MKKSKHTVNLGYLDSIGHTTLSRKPEDTIKEEYASIKQGTHFWCNAHLSAVIIEEQSKEDPRYCNFCYNIIQEEYKGREIIKELRLKEKELEKEKEIKPMKKQEAMELVEKLGAAYKLESNDGHYFVVQVATGQRIDHQTMKPLETTINSSAETNQAPVVEGEKETVRLGKRTGVLDNKTGITYKNRDNAYRALLENGELQDLVESGKLGKDPAHFYGFPRVELKFPGRFELIKG